jgi:uncharacterized membrane protein YeaQ/YmgE (transglycosylase-associated protein family)
VIKSFLLAHPAFALALLPIMAIYFSLVYTAGYLSVFDAQLIWVMEYSDVIKVGLVSIALLSTVAGAIALNFSLNYQNHGVDIPIWKIIAGWAIVGTICSLFVFWVADKKNEEILFSMVVCVVGAFATATILPVVLKKNSAAGYGVIVILSTFTYNFFGIHHGAIARDGDAIYEIFVRGEPKISSAKLVMITSKYVVLYKLGVSSVYPAERILKISRIHRSDLHAQ